jgi:hypothetical protein
MKYFGIVLLDFILALANKSDKFILDGLQSLRSGNRYIHNVGFTFVELFEQQCFVWILSIYLQTALHRVVETVYAY